LDTTVFIEGETGVGKELFARAIHRLSTRKNRALVKVNCAALPATLIEAELFGHEKGAFTGATKTRRGRFELADGGTLFLDEVGELPLELQGKILRVLQDGELERIGGEGTIRVDVRVIAATNRRLKEEIEQGSFREDLFYRLHVYPITVPSLRQRKEDLPLLVNALVQRFARDQGKRIDDIPQPVIEELEGYDWPGNVRELENVIERAVITSRDNKLRLAAKLPRPQKAHQEIYKGSLEDVERTYIRRILDHARWRIEGKVGTAELLKLHPNTLRFRMRKLGIERPER
jgi:formate hydrogenlyase transcriptional activator